MDAWRILPSLLSHLPVFVYSCILPRKDGVLRCCPRMLIRYDNSLKMMQGSPGIHGFCHSFYSCFLFSSLFFKPFFSKHTFFHQKSHQRLAQAIVLPMTHKERFENIGIQPPKGVLMHGPPGTGKTMMARACAAATSATFLKLVGRPKVKSCQVLKFFGLKLGC